MTYYFQPSFTMIRTPPIGNKFILVHFEAVQINPTFEESFYVQDRSQSLMNSATLFLHNSLTLRGLTFFKIAYVAILENADMLTLNQLAKYPSYQEKALKRINL